MIPPEWRRLRDGRWGLRGSAEILREGEPVEVWTEKGHTIETVKSILWEGPDDATGEPVRLVSVERDTRGRRPR